MRFPPGPSSCGVTPLELFAQLVCFSKIVPDSDMRYPEERSDLALSHAERAVRDLRCAHAERHRLLASFAEQLEDRVRRRANDLVRVDCIAASEDCAASGMCEPAADI